MKKNKKALIAMIAIVVTVFLIGTITTTYAWFLSRYSQEYTVVLQSDSITILKYESDLNFASGNVSSLDNVLTPAESDISVGIEKTALDPIDVFDTTKVKRAANTVKFTANGAYYTGQGRTAGDFRPELHAYLSSYATAHSLSQDTLFDALVAESSAAETPLTDNDLVAQGEVGFFFMINYLGKKFLYYDGTFYVSGVQSGSTFTFPAAAESNNELRYWHTATAENATVNAVQITDGTHFYLQPNKTFSFTLYVFIANDEELLARSVNGQRLTLFATLRTL